MSQSRRHRISAVLGHQRVVCGVPIAVAPLLIFAFFRLVDLGICIVVGTHQQWPAGTPDPVDPGAPHVMLQPPSAAHSLEYWDSQWYRQVAEHGYPSELPRGADGQVQRNVWAFYPLFPALVRGVMAFGVPFVVAGIAISLLAGAVAMCLLFDLMTETTSRFTAAATVVGLNAFPAAVTFGVPYTESLALLLIVGSLWLLRRQRYVALLVVSLLLSLARPVELPLAAVIALHGILRWRRERDAFELGQRVRLAAAAAVSIAAFPLWPLVAGLVTRTPDAYYLTQQAWHRDERLTGWHSWLAVVLGGGMPALKTGLVLGLLCLVAIGWRKVWPLEASAWTVAYTAYMAAVAWPTTASWRYAMLAIFPWWPFAGATLGDRRVRVIVLVVLATLGVVGQVLWVSKIWVIGPERLLHTVP